MIKLTNSRFGVASLVAAVAIGVFVLVGTTHAILVCPTTGGGEGSSGEGGGGTGGGVPEITGGCDSTPATIKYYLMQANYSETSAAAIMGNLSAESCGYKHRVYCGCSSEAEDGFKAYIQSGSGYTLNSRMNMNCGFGLVQWTPDSNKSVDRLLRLQKYADGKGGAITDLNIQIEFILKELTTTDINSYYYNVLKPEVLNTKSLKDATWRVEKWYEAPASVSGTPAGIGYGSSYEKVCADANTEWCKSLKKRIERAETALALDVSSCSPGSGTGGGTEGGGGSGSEGSGGGGGSGSEGSGGGEGSGGSEGTPPEVPVVTPPGGQPESHSEEGALGKQDINGAISQTDGGVKDTQWMPSSSSSEKKIGVNDDGKCCGSGCSLIAVANAYGALKNLSKSQVESKARELASWTKSNLSGPSPENTKKIARQAGLTPTEVWSSYDTSTSTKIAKIRSALASGGMIIAGGKRRGAGETSSDYCTSTRKSNGDCVFTPGGHYVAIIGITADNKLVVANPGKSNGRNWIFPAEPVLSRSNLGIMVK